MATTSFLAWHVHDRASLAQMVQAEQTLARLQVAMELIERARGSKVLDAEMEDSISDAQIRIGAVMERLRREQGASELIDGA